MTLWRLVQMWPCSQTWGCCPVTYCVWRELAAYVYTFIHTFLEIQESVNVYFSQNKCITIDINAFPACLFFVLCFFVFLISHYSPPSPHHMLVKWVFCLSLISFGEVCNNLIRKSKSWEVKQCVYNIARTVCECSGDKQSMGRRWVQSWIGHSSEATTWTLITSWTLTHIPFSPPEWE